MPVSRSLTPLSRTQDDYNPIVTLLMPAFGSIQALQPSVTRNNPGNGGKIEYVAVLSLSNYRT